MTDSQWALQSSPTRWPSRKLMDGLPYYSEVWIPQTLKAARHPETLFLLSTNLHPRNVNTHHYHLPEHFHCSMVPHTCSTVSVAHLFLEGTVPAIKKPVVMHCTCTCLRLRPHTAAAPEGLAPSAQAHIQLDAEYNQGAGVRQAETSSKCLRDTQLRVFLSKSSKNDLQGRYYIPLILTTLETKGCLGLKFLRNQLQTVVYEVLPTTKKQQDHISNPKDR